MANILQNKEQQNSKYFSLEISPLGVLEIERGKKLSWLKFKKETPFLVSF